MHLNAGQAATQDFDHHGNGVVRVERSFLVLLQVFVECARRAFQHGQQTDALECHKSISQGFQSNKKGPKLTLPNTRPDLPLTNSKLSAFFFCGIKLLPVLQNQGN